MREYRAYNGILYTHKLLYRLVLSYSRLSSRVFTSVTYEVMEFSLI